MIPRKPATEKPLCHIHDEVYDGEDIHQNVCVNDYSFTKHTDGKYYCLFHLPTKEKDTVKFMEIFQSRLEAVEKQVADVKKLPREEREKAKSKIKYDFGYVWFPSRIDLTGHKFEARTYFDSATFSDGADFDSATFSEEAYFIETKFSGIADFHSATFSDGVYFYLAKFSDDAHFRLATFSSYANFSRGTFSGDAVFSFVKFLETSQNFFVETEFCGSVYFNHTIFAGYIAFDGELNKRVFLENPARNQKTVLDLQNVRLEKPERISFHRVRLHPSWFVNTDSRKMIFTDIEWTNLKGEFRNKNIKAEIESLEERAISEPHRLLEIVSRQLAVNAEENNRYEEASDFRQMAMETKRISEYRGFKIWSLHWWYWLSSLYGESWKRAFVVLLGILLIFTIYYQFAFFQICPQNFDDKTNCSLRTMQLVEAVQQSLYTAALQNIEYRKTSTSGQDMVILLEKIFVPLQAALLALAIRRKFMR